MIHYSPAYSDSKNISPLLTLLVAVKDPDQTFNVLLNSLLDQDPFFMEVLFIDASKNPSTTLESITRLTLKKGWLNCSDVPHAVGAVLRTSLHDYNGFYSNRYPICADKHFLRKCMLNGASTQIIPIVIGRYSQNGKSSRETRHYLVDLFNAQVDLGENFYLQLFLLLLRLLIHGRACSRKFN